MLFVFVGVVLFILGRIAWCKQDGETITGDAYYEIDDLQKRLRDTMEKLSNLPSNKHKHVIMLVDVSYSMEDDCHLIEPTVTSVLKHFEKIDNVYVSLLTFGGWKIMKSHISINEFSVSETDFECVHATPMKTAFEKAVEFVENYENDLSIGMLITDGQSTEDLTETREAAKAFREKMGTLGEDTLGLFAIGLVDASERELNELSSGPGYFSYYSELNVLLEDLKNSVHIIDEESKKKELVKVEIERFTYEEVGDTRDNVPIHLEIIEEEGKLGKDVLRFSIEEIIRDDRNEHDTFFYTMDNLEATRMEETSEGGRARYQFDGHFEPRKKNERYLAQKVPYDFRVVSDEINVVFQSNILNFSVSAYVRYFDAGVTILPLGEGMVGKSLWIQTIHITHSSEIRFSDVAFGKNMQGDRTTKIVPFRMSKREQDGVHGNPNTYIDIFGEDVYFEDFLERLLKGYIPKGFTKEEYDSRNRVGGYDDKAYEDFPTDPALRMDPVDSIAYLVKGEQFNSETYQATIKQNIDMFRRINMGIPIVVIASCHDTIQCSEEDVKKQKEVLKKVCGDSCLLRDLDPYLKPDIDDKLFFTLKKKPKKDKNQWSISESIMHRVVDSRKGMITNFCDENEKVCEFLEKTVRLRVGSNYDGIELLYEEEKFKCIRLGKKCTDNYEEDKMSSFCAENWEVCKYPWTPVVKDTARKLETMEDMKKEGEDWEVENKKWKKECSSTAEAGKKCKEKYKEHIRLGNYCHADDFSEEVCKFYHSTDPTVVAVRTRESTVRNVDQCREFFELSGYDGCRAEYGRIRVKEYCNGPEMNKFVCNSLMKVDGKAVSQLDYFIDKQDKKEIFEELIECLDNHQKCVESCRKTQVDAYCMGEGKSLCWKLRVMVFNSTMDRKEAEDKIFDCSRNPEKLDCSVSADEPINQIYYSYLKAKAKIQENYAVAVGVGVTILLMICGIGWMVCLC